MTMHMGLRKATKTKLAISAVLAIAALLISALPSQGVGLAQHSSRTFPETGRTVRGVFLDYWNTHGALVQQGFPISEQLEVKSETDGRLYTMQYFERAVFEHHPENSPPYDILLTLLGTLGYNERYPIGRPSGLVVLPPEGQVSRCAATHDDGDNGAAARSGFDPEAPHRQVVGEGHVVRGRVLSSKDCLPIAGAKVEMRPDVRGDHPEAQRATLYTDAAGWYRFESEQPNHIHIRASAHGFRAIIANQYHPPPNQAHGNFDIVLVPDPGCRQFKETGQALCGVFLDYWEQHGGLAQQGYPISDEFEEKSHLNGRTYRVQYFERAVFELHPENSPPFHVLLSQLGTLRYKAKAPPVAAIRIRAATATDTKAVALVATSTSWQVLTKRLEPVTNGRIP